MATETKTLRINLTFDNGYGCYIAEFPAGGIGDFYLPYNHKLSVTENCELTIAELQKRYPGASVVADDNATGMYTGASGYDWN